VTGLRLAVTVTPSSIVSLVTIVAEVSAAWLVGMNKVLPNANKVPEAKDTWRDASGVVERKDKGL
jgi:hypothetical protein